MELQRNISLNKGKYIIVSCLGQGGFGITYKALRSVDNTMVCVKEFFVKSICFRNEANSYVQVVREQESFIRHKQLFLKEAKTLIGISHPNIIKVLDVFEENNTAYYVMEFVEGESLSEKIPSYGMQESDAVSIISLLCDAVGYLHQQNITHLDIKPKNILVSNSGKITLIDFGGSKRYSEWGEETSSSPTAVSEGFAPIELYREKALSHFSPETDMYEIGATLYNMVSGKTPPPAWNLLEEQLPLNLLNISPNVAHAIASAMCPYRQKRCHDVDSFLRILSENTASSDDTDIDITDVDFDSTIINVGNVNNDKRESGTERIETVINGISTIENGKNKKLIWIVGVVCLFLIAGLSIVWYINTSDVELEETRDACETVENELSQYVESANNINPFVQQQSIFHIDSLAFRNKMLIFYVAISPEGKTLFDELQSSDAVRKQYVIAGLRVDSELYERCQQLIQIDGSLRYIIRFGEESVEITLDSNELLEIEPYAGTEDSKKEQKYVAVAQNVTNQCPSKISDGVVMTGCKYENGAIVYTYDCTSEAFSVIRLNIEEHKSDLSQQFMNDEALKKFVEIAGQDDVSIVYEYKKIKSNSIIKLTYNSRIKKFI